ncbi:MAG: hypothetical protein ACLVJH_14775 [Faecalibacterium prausnitzii]
MPVRGLFYGEEGFRHFFTVKPVATIDDLKGMKLRVSNDPVMNGMVEGLALTHRRCFRRAVQRTADRRCGWR